jgi:hypothetical protein
MLSLLIFCVVCYEVHNAIINWGISTSDTAAQLLKLFRISCILQAHIRDIVNIWLPRDAESSDDCIFRVNFSLLSLFWKIQIKVTLWDQHADIVWLGVKLSLYRAVEAHRVVRRRGSHII